MDIAVEWFLTAPYDPVLVRRGDPLGLRTASDRIADILAPGLSNRTHDARWLSILSWILVQVDEARRVFRYDRLEQIDRDAAREIYEWIRPLELLWIKRTLKLSDPRTWSMRQLPGRRAVEQWDGRSPRFGMNTNQFNRYRFAGVYGAYRTLLCSLPGMTIGGDGFRPDGKARSLSQAIENAVPKARRPRYHRGRKPPPEQHWLSAWRGWSKRKISPYAILPERINEGKLGPKERRLLKGLLFENSTATARRRRTVAELCAKAWTRDHAQLCGFVATKLRPQLAPDERNAIGLIEPFSRFADAGVDAMITIWNATSPENGGPRFSLSRLTRAPEVTAALGTLRQEAAAWSRAAAGDAPALFRVANELSQELRAAKGNEELLKALVSHHLRVGGGRRWFTLLDQKLARDADTSGRGASKYRFRLWALSHLAWQCRVIDRRPAALSEEADTDDDARDGTRP
jgi:hypothetical protein